MPEIVLSTLNAKYIHASFGLRCIYANLGDLKSRSTIREFHINERALDIAESILSENPKIIGFGVYIWNAVETLQVIKLLKSIAPEICIVLGGPEISYETEQQELTSVADYVLTGEADLTFSALCKDLLEGNAKQEKIISSPVPDVAKLSSPYEFYTDQDLKHRMVYVEASRGCPFTCEFCLSSLEIPVRQFELEPFLSEMDKLFKRGLRQFKFVDRTFNLNIRTSKAILQFFLERYEPGLFVHFEMIPDRLPDALREVIKKFPAGALQFEIGIQSFNEETGKLISRKQDYSKVEDNLRYLREQTGVHLHVDLIAGLPAEDIDSFALGFDRLVAMNPHEIQLGILKRLRGTPIVRHDKEFCMVYSSEPPYEILKNNLIDFSTMQRISRFSRYWDLCANSGNFVETVKLFWKASNQPFISFMAWSDWLYSKVKTRHSIALHKLTELLWLYLTEVLEIEKALVANTLANDFIRCGRKDYPDEARQYLAPESITVIERSKRLLGSEKVISMPRQKRHQPELVATSENLVANISRSSS